MTILLPEEAFRYCAAALVGTDPGWKSRLAGILKVKVDTVDNWAKGKSRISPGVWADLAAEMQLRKVFNWTGFIDLALKHKDKAKS